MNMRTFENLFYFADGVPNDREKELQRFLGGLSANIRWVDTPLKPRIQLANFREVASRRALDAFGRIDQPVFLEEIGVVIPKLGGYPGTLTDFVIDRIGLSGIDCLVAKMCEFRRDFRCQVILITAYMDRSLQNPQLFWSVVSGWWKVGGLIKRKSEDDTVWDHIVPNGFERSVATMDTAKRFEFEEGLASAPQPYHLIQFRNWLIQTGRVTVK